MYELLEYRIKAILAPNFSGFLLNGAFLIDDCSFCLKFGVCYSDVCCLRGKNGDRLKVIIDQNKRILIIYFSIIICYFLQYS